MNVAVEAPTSGDSRTRSSTRSEYPAPRRSITAGALRASALPVKPSRKPRPSGEMLGEHLRRRLGDLRCRVDGDAHVPAVLRGLVQPHGQHGAERERLRKEAEVDR